MPENSLPECGFIRPAHGLWLHRARVRPEWVDYNGHMNEAYYVVICGDATDAFYDHIGINAAFRETHHVSAYTLETHIRYLIETHVDEEVIVGTWLLSHDSKRLRLHHSMRRMADGAELCVMELIALHVNTEKLGAAPFHPVTLTNLAHVAVTQGIATLTTPATSKHWQSAA